MPWIFAASTDVGISADMLEPVVDALMDNIAVVIPIGVVLFGVLLGINLVPKLLKKFSKG